MNVLQSTSDIAPCQIRTYCRVVFENRDSIYMLDYEGDIGVCGVAVLLSFLCGISVNKIPHCGIAVISNPAVCVVCVFKPPVYGETKLFAMLRFLVGPLYNNRRPLSSLSELNL